MSIAARKRFNCVRSTEAQIQSVETSGEFNNVTPEEVEAALMKGDEVRLLIITYFNLSLTGWQVFGVWEMKLRKGKTEEVISAQKAQNSRKRKRQETPGTTSEESDTANKIVTDSDND